MPENVPTDISELVFLVVIALPAVICHSAWRNVADVRDAGHAEGRHSSLLLWASLCGVITLLAWSKLSAVITAVLQGPFGWRSARDGLLALVVVPWLMGVVLGHVWLRMAPIPLFGALGFMGAGSRTPWDYLTCNRNVPLYVWFADREIEYRGTMWRADVNAKQLWLDDIHYVVGETLEPKESVTGALLFLESERVLWFTEWDDGAPRPERIHGPRNWSGRIRQRLESRRIGRPPD